MLVLSRKRDEKVVINDDIIVTVIEIRGDKVRLGFDAPKEVPVHREEVWAAINRDKAKAIEQDEEKGEDEDRSD